MVAFVLASTKLSLVEHVPRWLVARYRKSAQRVELDIFIFNWAAVTEVAASRVIPVRKNGGSVKMVLGPSKAYAKAYYCYAKGHPGSEA